MAGKTSLTRGLNSKYENFKNSNRKLGSSIVLWCQNNP